MKTGARTGFQNRVAPDCRAQDCSYLYLNIYLLSILKEKFKKFGSQKMPPPIINWEIENLRVFL